MQQSPNPPGKARLLLHRGETTWQRENGPLRPRKPARADAVSPSEVQCARRQGHASAAPGKRDAGSVGQSEKPRVRVEPLRANQESRLNRRLFFIYVALTVNSERWRDPLCARSTRDIRVRTFAPRARIRCSAPDNSSDLPR